MRYTHSDIWRWIRNTKSESSREMAQKTCKGTILEDMIKQIKNLYSKGKKKIIKPMDHPEK